MSKKWIYAVITAAGLTVALATPAAAHVITDPGEATQGHNAAFAFLVPNERTDAGTVKLEVTLPTDHPIGSVYTKPLAGWTAQVVKEGDAVRRITWTAQQGVRIDPGQYQEFTVSIGPLPTDTDKLVMPAVQTYDNGQVVAWDEPPTSGAEPQRPAPLLILRPAPAGGGTHGADGGHAHGGSGTTVTDVATSTHGATDSAARWLSGAGSAAAHNFLTGSDPTDGAQVATGPVRVSLTFNLPVQRGFSTVTVTGPDGNQWQAGPPDEAGAVVSAPVRPLGPAGQYTIAYQVLSADGHPVRGAVRFTLTNPGPGAAAAPPTPDRSGIVASDAATHTGSGSPVWPWLAGAGVLLAAGVAVALRVGR